MLDQSDIGRIISSSHAIELVNVVATICCGYRLVAGALNEEHVEVVGELGHVSLDGVLFKLSHVRGMYLDSLGLSHDAHLPFVEALLLECWIVDRITIVDPLSCEKKKDKKVSQSMLSPMIGPQVGQDRLGVR